MVLIVKCLICNKELTYTQDDPKDLITHMKREHPLVQGRKKHSEDQDFREKVKKDWRQSLEFNAEILNSLIDKEVQTEVDWNYFVKMSDTQQNKRSSKSSTKTQDTVIEILSPPKSSSAPAKLSLDQKYAGERIPLKNSSTSTSKSKNDRFQNEAIEMNTVRDGQKLREKRNKFYKTSIEKWRPVGNEKIHCPRCESHKRPIVRTHTERVTQSSIASSLLLTCWPICFAPCFFPEPTRENLHCPVCNYYLGVYDHRAKKVLSNPNLADS